MLIDLPIVIVFGASGITQRDLDAAKSAKVCTLRFNITDDDAPGELFDHYPPRDDAQHLGEPGNPVLAMLSSRAYGAIKAMAARSPYDFMVGTEQERVIAQEEVDQQLADGGQFGAGA